MHGYVSNWLSQGIFFTIILPQDIPAAAHQAFHSWKRLVLLSHELSCDRIVHPSEPQIPSLTLPFCHTSNCCFIGLGIPVAGHMPHVWNGI